MATVLITGASGFIGSHIAEALAEAGHEVRCAVRKCPSTGRWRRFRCIPADYTRDFDPVVWQRRLEGVDVVVNAVGILREHGSQTFEALHDRAPRALFAAAAGVRIVQISALGADEEASSRYHLSKKAADDALLASSKKRGGRAAVACIWARRDERPTVQYDRKLAVDSVAGRWRSGDTAHTHRRSDRSGGEAGGNRSLSRSAYSACWSRTSYIAAISG